MTINKRADTTPKDTEYTSTPLGTRTPWCQDGAEIRIKVVPESTWHQNPSNIRLAARRAVSGAIEPVQPAEGEATPRRPCHAKPVEPKTTEQRPAVMLCQACQETHRQRPRWTEEGGLFIAEHLWALDTWDSVAGHSGKHGISWPRGRTRGQAAITGNIPQNK